MLTINDTYKYITTERELDLVERDLTDYCKIFEDKNRKPKMVYDTETYSFTGRHKPILLPDGTFEAYPRLVQFGLDPEIEDCQYLIDIKAINGIKDRVAYTKDKAKAEYLIKQKFEKFFKNCIMIGQTLSFDAMHLIAHFDIWAEWWRDCMLLSQIQNAGDKYTKRLDKRSHKLYALYETYLDYGWFIEHTKSRLHPNGMNPYEFSLFKAKMQQEDWGVLDVSDDQLYYAAKDVQTPHYLYKRLIEELDKIIKKYNKPGLSNTFRIECAAINEFATAQIVGVDVDLRYYDEEVIPYLNKYVDDSESALSIYPEFWEEQKNETTQVLLMDGSKIKVSNRKQSIPYSKFINLNGKATAAGPGQLQRALARAGLEVPNSQRGTFEELLYDPDNEHTLTSKQKVILSKVIQYLNAKSMLSKYGANLYSGEDSCLYADGKFHPDIFQMGGESNGVDTQRTSMKGPALQTIPSGGDIFDDGEKIGKKLRKPYIAGKGYKLIVADWDNEEVRIATQLTKDPYLITVFKEKRDQHSETAKEILNLDYLPEKGSPERQAGKTGYLGHQYQQGWKGMQAKVYEDTKCKLWIPDEKAKDMKKRLKAKFQGVTDKSDESNNEVKRAVQDYDSLIHFENRRPIFIGFTQLKYNTELLRDIIDLGSSKKVELTRLRKWCLYIEQERKVKRIKRGLVDFIIKKRSLKRLAKLFMTKIIVSEDGKKTKPKTMVFSNRFYQDFPIKRRIRPTDTLHKKYKVYSEERDEWSDWNNEFNKRINTIGREYFNFLIQPEGSTMLKLAMIGIGKEFRKRGWTYNTACVILEAHDEIIARCKEEIVDECKQIVDEVMERVFRSVVDVVPATVTSHIADNWADGK